jgi:uncharacterized protein YlzI (FlbEa/FlbD family)
MDGWIQLSDGQSGKSVIVNMAQAQMITANPETTLWFRDSATFAVRESLAQIGLLLRASGP